MIALSTVPLGENSQQLQEAATKACALHMYMYSAAVSDIISFLSLPRIQRERLDEPSKHLLSVGHAP